MIMYSGWRGDLPNYKMRLTEPKSLYDLVLSIRRERSGMSPKDKTVLIVEDNELNMKLFHDLLEMNGYATL